MPRDAPVTSAMRPVRSGVSVMNCIRAWKVSSVWSLPAGSQDRQRADVVLALVVKQPRRILRGEAGVAILRLVLVAHRLADGAVEPVDRQEAQRIHADEIGHLL